MAVAGTAVAAIGGTALGKVGPMDGTVLGKVGPMDGTVLGKIGDGAVLGKNIPMDGIGNTGARSLKPCQRTRLPLQLLLQRMQLQARLWRFRRFQPSITTGDLRTPALTTPGHPQSRAQPSLQQALRHHPMHPESREPFQPGQPLQMR